MDYLVQLFGLEHIFGPLIAERKLVGRNIMGMRQLELGNGVKHSSVQFSY